MRIEDIKSTSKPLKSIRKNQYEKAREAGLKGTHPVVEYCEICQKNKVKHHHNLCDVCHTKIKNKR